MESMPRVELSCHTYYSSMDGILSPQDWINIAGKWIPGAGDYRLSGCTGFLGGGEGRRELAQGSV